ncbi:DUF397 domain-containing protein [Nocardia sp. CA-084685]|uniref:DUF397 domain-containing protein n=1 Tax=Nocardia sp. CA-084685 TaxID=3239970 RepID=UPI003D957958
MTQPTFTVAEFRKATFSSPNQNCVRVARRNGWTAVWDDKLADERYTPEMSLPDNELLVFTDDQFDAFQVGMRAGRVEDLHLAISRRDGGYVFQAAIPQLIAGVELRFDEAEFDAFRQGVLNHEFDCARFIAA